MRFLQGLVGLLSVGVFGKENAMQSFSPILQKMLYPSQNLLSCSPESLEAAQEQRDNAFMMQYFSNLAQDLRANREVQAKAITETESNNEEQPEPRCQVVPQPVLEKEVLNVLGRQQSRYVALNPFEQNPPLILTLFERKIPCHFSLPEYMQDRTLVGPGF